MGPMGDVSADTGTRPGTAPSGAGSADRGSPVGTFSTASRRVPVLSVDGTSDCSTSASKVPETLSSGVGPERRKTEIRRRQMMKRVRVRRAKKENRKRSHQNFTLKMEFGNGLATKGR